MSIIPGRLRSRLGAAARVLGRYLHRLPSNDEYALIHEGASGRVVSIRVARHACGTAWDQQPFPEEQFHCPAHRRQPRVVREWRQPEHLIASHDLPFHESIAFTCVRCGRILFRQTSLR